VTLLYGARTPSERLYPAELQEWREAGITVESIVDRPEPGWDGDVGVVTKLIERARFDSPSAVALVCGPEIMMRFAAAELLKRGLSPERLFLSLERSMKCGVGHCGHCQLGPLLLCRDGPVLAHPAVAEWMAVRAL
jgi:anaerobic sulfite reductase subunit B